MMTAAALYWSSECRPHQVPRASQLGAVQGTRGLSWPVQPRLQPEQPEACPFGEVPSS